MSLNLVSINLLVLYILFLFLFSGVFREGWEGWGGRQECVKGLYPGHNSSSVSIKKMLVQSKTGHGPNSVSMEIS